MDGLNEPISITTEAGTMDITDFSQEELDYMIATGGELPESRRTATVQTDKPEVKEVVADEIEAQSEETTEEEQPVSEDAPDEDANTDEVAANELEVKVANFKFTPDADAATRQAEEQEYLAMVDLPEPIQEILNAREARIAELEQTPHIDRSTAEHMEIFNKLVEFVPTPDGRSWKPNTEPAIQFLERQYGQEFNQLVTDVMVRPSRKYDGHTIFEEKLIDTFQLSEAGTENLNYLLRNGGELPNPDYLPQGVNREFMNAYWQSPNRQVLNEEIAQANYTLYEDRAATPEEKAKAQINLDQINRDLQARQEIINYNLSKRAAELEQRQSFERTVYTEGEQRYHEMNTQFIKNATESLVKQLEPIFGASSRTIAAQFAQTISSGFADNDVYAKLAQEQLAVDGIKVDWAQASEVTNDLYRTHCKIVALEKSKANPRAIELEKQNLAKSLLKMKTLEKTLVGQFLANVNKGTTTALKKKVESVGKKVPVRPRVSGNGDNTPVPNYDSMPHDQLVQTINKMMRDQANAGMR